MKIYIQYIFNPVFSFEREKKKNFLNLPANRFKITSIIYLLFVRKFHEIFQVIKLQEFIVVKTKLTTMNEQKLTVINSHS